MAIIGSGVRVRGAPAEDGRTLGVLSFAVLPLAREASPGTIDRAGRWIAVRLRDGQIGYVASEYVRSPIDYRAIFARAGDKWQLVTFIAGD